MPWEEYLAFDDLLTSIGNDGGQRLAFQASYPCIALLGAHDGLHSG